MDSHKMSIPQFLTLYNHMSELYVLSTSKNRGSLIEDFWLDGRGRISKKEVLDLFKQLIVDSFGKRLVGMGSFNVALSPAGGWLHRGTDYRIQFILQAEFVIDVKKLKVHIVWETQRPVPEDDNTNCIKLIEALLLRS